MNIEARRAFRTATKAVKDHEIGLRYAMAATLIIAGPVAAITSLMKSLDRDVGRIQELKLKYPGLPSQEELDRVFQKVNALDAQVLEKTHEALEAGKITVIVDFSEMGIGDIQNFQKDIGLAKQNEKFIAEKEEVLSHIDKDVLTTSAKGVGGVMAFLGGLFTWTSTANKNFHIKRAKRPASLNLQNSA